MTDARVARMRSTPLRRPANWVTEWVSDPAPATPIRKPPTTSVGSDAPKAIRTAVAARVRAQARAAPHGPKARTTGGTTTADASSPTAIIEFGSADAQVGAPSSAST